MNSKRFPSLAAWVAALRDPKYTQGFRQFTTETDGQRCFCALGVGILTVVPNVTAENDCLYLGHSGDIAGRWELMDRLNQEEIDVLYVYRTKNFSGNDVKACYAIVTDNDRHRMSFTEIAAKIEAAAIYHEEMNPSDV